jgi:Na+-transporting NADH:ubiquinone oxidoreductase subunit C
MVVIAAVFTAVVSGVHVTMKDNIEENKKLARIRGILEAAGIAGGGDAAADALLALAENRLTEKETDGITWHLVSDENGAPAGYVFPMGGPGFWGPIEGYLGVGPDGTVITGISVTSHTETPGLGGRIAEDWFEDQFEGRSIHPEDNNGSPISIVPGTGSKVPQDVDAITGATGTSNRFEKIIREAAETARSITGKTP